jgi:hypothetical protein
METFCKQQKDGIRQMTEESNNLFEYLTVLKNS